MDTFSVLSWNVQGLGGALCRRFKARIRRALHKVRIWSCDLITLQEHHLDASKIQSYGNMLRGDLRYYWIPACGQTENKCGVSMILNDKWVQFVLHSQQVVEGRALKIGANFYKDRATVLHTSGHSSPRICWPTCRTSGLLIPRYVSHLLFDIR